MHKCHAGELYKLSQSFVAVSNKAMSSHISALGQSELRHRAMKFFMRLLSAWIVVFLARDASQAETRVGNVVIAMQPGECQVTLNGTDLGCAKSAVDTQLQNGRRLVNFPATDVATVGFAGGKIEATGAASSILWVDAAYINQQRFDADGQCSFERTSGGSIQLECKAVLHDGRKLSASLKSATQKDAFLGLKLPVSQKSDCEKLMNMHGMLTRAQFQCNFSKYNSALIDQARDCRSVVGTNNVEPLLLEGMKTFDANERERGRKAVCKAILNDFPNYVAN